MKNVFKPECRQRATCVVREPEIDGRRIARDPQTLIGRDFGVNPLDRVQCFGQPCQGQIGVETVQIDRHIRGLGEARGDVAHEDLQRTMDGSERESRLVQRGAGVRHRELTCQLTMARETLPGAVKLVEFKRQGPRQLVEILEETAQDRVTRGVFSPQASGGRTER